MGRGGFLFILRLLCFGKEVWVNAVRAREQESTGQAFTEKLE
ncbi:hypothetical protein PALA111701_12385 [Paenibacillus lactis]